MIKISKLSDLEGAEKYGTCTVCHKNSDEDELYSITVGTENFMTSTCLCKSCAIQLNAKLTIAIGGGDPESIEWRNPK